MDIKDAPGYIRGIYFGGFGVLCSVERVTTGLQI